MNRYTQNLKQDISNNCNWIVKQVISLQKRGFSVSEAIEVIKTASGLERDDAIAQLGYALRDGGMLTLNLGTTEDFPLEIKKVKGDR